MSDIEPASGQEIADVWRTFPHDEFWPDNWSQGPSRFDWSVPGTTTTIQGVLCCVDLDVTASWLLMIVDPAPQYPDQLVTVSYLAITYGSGWHWIKADDNFDAIHKFVTWVEIGYEALR